MGLKFCLKRSRSISGFDFVREDTSSLKTIFSLKWQDLHWKTCKHQSKKITCTFLFPVCHFRFQQLEVYTQKISPSSHILSLCCASWRSWVCELPRWRLCTSCWRSDSWHLWHIWGGPWSRPAETPCPSETSQTPQFPWSPGTQKNLILIKDTIVSQTEINSLSQDKDTILIFKWFLSTAHKIYFVYVLKYH